MLRGAASALPVTDADDAVLSTVEGEVLGTRFIEELLAVVDTSPDPTASPGRARAARG